MIKIMLMMIIIIYHIIILRSSNNDDNNDGSNILYDPASEAPGQTPESRAGLPSAAPAV